MVAIESAIGPSDNGDGLGTKIDRWLALEAQNAGKAIEITSEQAAFLEKMNPCFRERHVDQVRRASSCRPTRS